MLTHEDARWVVLLFASVPSSLFFLGLCDLAHSMRPSLRAAGGLLIAPWLALFTAVGSAGTLEVCERMADRAEVCRWVREEEARRIERDVPRPDRLDRMLRDCAG